MMGRGPGLSAAVVVAGVMAVTGLLVHLSAMPAAAATEPCLEEYGLEAPGTAMPVIVVHGIWSSAERMRGFEEILDANRTEFSVTRFDYEPLNREWVDHDGIGVELRRHLMCLADASLAAGGIGRVGFVGHSMGGLAIRVALDGGPNEPALSDEVAVVVTLGTPHGGSHVGTSTRRVDVARALYAQASQLEARQIKQRGHLISLGTAIQADHLVGPGASPAARALRSSDELEALPQVPEGVPVLSVAADYVEQSRLLFYTSDPYPLGDLIVPADSAHQHAREVDGLGGVQTHRCHLPSRLNPLGGLAELGVLWRSDQRLLDCWHGSIVSVEPTTTRAVTQLVAASGREPRQPTPEETYGRLDHRSWGPIEFGMDIETAALSGIELADFGDSAALLADTGCGPFPLMDDDQSIGWVLLLGEPGEARLVGARIEAGPELPGGLAFGLSLDEVIAVADAREWGLTHDRETPVGGATTVRIWPEEDALQFGLELTVETGAVGGAPEGVVSVRAGLLREIDAVDGGFC